MNDFSQTEITLNSQQLQQLQALFNSGTVESSVTQTNDYVKLEDTRNEINTFQVLLSQLEEGDLRAKGAAQLLENNEDEIYHFTRVEQEIILQAAKRCGVSKEKINKQFRPKLEAENALEAMDIGEAITTLGYKLRWDILSSCIEIWNGEWTRADSAALTEIRNTLKPMFWGNTAELEPNIQAKAQEKSYNALVECLEGSQWDGVDYIAQLAGYFTDEHDEIEYEDGTKRTVFHAFVRRWLIGAVGKIMRTEQNPMLVIGGGQGLGKGYFAEWICADDQRFHDGALDLNYQAKDMYARLASKKVWLMDEINSSFKKSDMDALKNFLTLKTTNVRLPYDKIDTQLTAVASFIGTFNPDGVGILSDVTGNRRFNVVNLEFVDWSYATEINPNDLWAQAYALWINGEKATLSPEEKAMQQALNAENLIHDPLEDLIVQDFVIEPQNSEIFTKSSDLTTYLSAKTKYSGDRTLSIAISKTLARLGLKRKAVRVDGKSQQCWVGIAPELRVQRYSPFLD